MRVAEWLWENPVLQREWAGRPRRETRRRALAGWLAVAVVLAFYGAAAH